MNEELNKKLAKFAHRSQMNDPFTESLDACDKWLLPKLKGEQPELKISLIDNGERIGCVISLFGKLTSRKKNMQWIQVAGAFGDNYALALCLAIEKLIDSEEKC